MVKVLVIGDLMTDVYIEGNIERINQEAATPIVKIKNIKKTWGGAGNVVRNLISLGAKVKLFTSNNEVVKTRVFVNNQQLIRLDAENVVKTSYTKKHIDDLKKLCKWSDWIIISDYDKGTITGELMKGITDFKHKIIADIKPQNKAYYHGVYLITPNEREVIGKNTVLAGVDLMSELNTNVLITRGKKGATLITKDNIKHYPTKPVELVNVIGAGDTFLATFVYYLNLGLDKAINLANKAAGIVIRKIGTNIITKEEIYQES